jgi:DNA end-binding protein Ku
MPRALWTGAISFGLVHIPVELYPATEHHSLQFHMLDRRNMGPVGYRKINKQTGKEVTLEDIVKGYEYEKGRFVVLNDEDFRKANEHATQTVEILSFVKEAEIPSLYYDTPYYLAPGKRGEKVYALLRETMRKAGRSAIATVVIQARQHLALVTAQERMLVLCTLRYAEDIRSIGDFKLPAAGPRAAGVTPKEIDMALKLIGNMSGEWEPSQYHDSYRDDLLARIDARIKAGKTTELAEADETAAAKPRGGGKVVDLVALLQDSVRKRPGSKSGLETQKTARASVHQLRPRGKTTARTGKAKAIRKRA